MLIEALGDGIALYLVILDPMKQYSLENNNANILFNNNNSNNIKHYPHYKKSREKIKKMDRFPFHASGNVSTLGMKAHTIDSWC